MIERFGRQRVKVRKPIGETLGLRNAAFPARSSPDLVVDVDDAFHVCELKSSRTDYNRFDNVFDSRPFRDYLVSRGHDGSPPWEVEQDLIKLRLFHQLSDRVASCLFLMVDAYAGSGHSWTAVFSDVDTFLSTMRTDLVRGWAQDIWSATTIESVVAGPAEARIIACMVRPTSK
jgi:hypothetical protein